MSEVNIQFIPSKYAKKNCSQCYGRGLIRVHVAIAGRVEPKANNIATKPCGCATRRYLKAVQKARQT